MKPKTKNWIFGIPLGFILGLIMIFGATLAFCHNPAIGKCPEYCTNFHMDGSETTYVCGERTCHVCEDLEGLMKR